MREIGCGKLDRDRRGTRERCRDAPKSLKRFMVGADGGADDVGGSERDGWEGELLTRQQIRDGRGGQPSIRYNARTRHFLAAERLHRIASTSTEDLTRGDALKDSIAVYGVMRPFNVQFRSFMRKLMLIMTPYLEPSPKPLVERLIVHKSIH